MALDWWVGLCFGWLDVMIKRMNNRTPPKISACRCRPGLAEQYDYAVHRVSIWFCLRWGEVRHVLDCDLIPSDHRLPPHPTQRTWHIRPMLWTLTLCCFNVGTTQGMCLVFAGIVATQSAMIIRSSEPLSVLVTSPPGSISPSVNDCHGTGSPITRSVTDVAGFRKQHIW